jgi:APA family basic amino acid/polyamine antiporter
MSENKISGFAATNLVVANMIGVGVFTSLGFQVIGIHSNFALLSLWLIGGLIALCGALSYAELAAALPKSGGEYYFLSRIYHPVVGFMAGWLSATVGFAAPVALAAMAFGTYFQGFVPILSPLVLSLLVVWLTTGVLLTGVRSGEVFQNLTTILKLVMIFVFIVAGILLPNKQPFSLAATAKDLGEMLSWPFALSMFFVMYSYSGWNAASYITAEVRDAPRNVPMALLIGTTFVTILYALLNFVFLVSTPTAKLAGQLNVGLIAGESIFGPIGGKVASAVISLGLIASVNAMIWIGSRITKAMADDFKNLRFFGRTNRFGVPHVALILQLVIITTLILSATFETILLYVQFSLLLSSFVAVLGLFVLRIREPDLERPYRVWGYPVTPAIFLLMGAYLLIYSAYRNPWESGLGFLTLLAGIVVYFLCRGKSAQAAESSQRDNPVESQN